MKRNQKSATKEKHLTVSEEEWYDAIADNAKIAFASPGRLLDIEVAKMIGENRLTIFKRLFRWTKPESIKHYSSDMTAAWEVFLWAVNRNYGQRKDFFKAMSFLTGGCFSWPDILIEYRGDMACLICRSALIAHLKEG